MFPALARSLESQDSFVPITLISIWLGHHGSPLDATYMRRHLRFRVQSEEALEQGKCVVGNALGDSVVLDIEKPAEVACVVNLLCDPLAVL